MTSINMLSPRARKHMVVEAWWRRARWILLLVGFVAGLLVLLERTRLHLAMREMDQQRRRAETVYALQEGYRQQEEQCADLRARLAALSTLRTRPQIAPLMTVLQQAISHLPGQVELWSVHTTIDSRGTVVAIAGVAIDPTAIDQLVRRLQASGVFGTIDTSRDVASSLRGLTFQLECRCRPEVSP